ncbi:PilZ domain-containing protein [Paenibacillus montanisoli]|uniref:PilZ domain-containing protein n=1 Tax=Paenibacillus montanisoli TaxID=2081970 RepID=A0A328TXZ5_9BACL|nr:PilZ domain-containing protein [Paenibacillus montanisoli]RAP75320.1 PilZ domain-containing protein [Paenibacillus montanisoli]
MAVNKDRIKERYGLTKPFFALKALLHSRTTVEKEGYVSTGVLSYAEGEMMEIELSEYKNFELGDPVQLTVYSPVGVHRLQTTIIAKAEGAVAVIITSRLLAGLEEKRESLRVEVDMKGTITRTCTQEVERSNGEKTVIDIEDNFDVAVRNISDSGIGFSLMTGEALQKGETLKAVLFIGFRLNCQLEIIRSEESGEWGYYGARFHELDEQRQRALRAFLLKTQVEAYFMGKQERTGSKGIRKI